MKYLYRLYQLLICLPILVLASILTSLVTVIGCRLGNGHFWGYYPGKWWSILWIRLLLLPVKVEGREHLKKNQSYVFVANHQGAFDIFLIYGFLGPNGAGKSTTMNMMTGYIAATSGTVKINGYDILKNPEQAKKSIGYFHLFIQI